MNPAKGMNFLLELLFPSRAVCLGCGDGRGCNQPYLCDTCQYLLHAADIHARRPDWLARHLSGAYFVYYYGRPIRGLISHFKFHGVRVLADTFAPELARLLNRRITDSFDCLAPVPLHPSRQRERGYNQAEVLARALSARTGIPVRTDLLFRTRKTHQQARLQHSRRTANLQGAFTATEAARGLRILLVDDVITTGGTVCACAETLHAVGARDVQAISVAGTHYFRSREARRYRKPASPIQ